MTTALKALLILNFLVEALSGLCLMIIPAQTAAALYPALDVNALAVKFARTTGTAMFALGLLSILPLTARFGSSVPLVLLILTAYHLLASAHNAYLLFTGGGAWLPTAIHSVLFAGFAVYMRTAVEASGPSPPAEHVG